MENLSWALSALDGALAQQVPLQGGLCLSPCCFCTIGTTHSPRGQPPLYRSLPLSCQAWDRLWTPVAVAAPRQPALLTQCAELNLPTTTAGPKDRAGFMEQPVK